ncbi:MAG: ABC transporter ATP-binding protein [Lachnospiraceae bacterium]|nr:ABC transporter ATP-binding protein [Lachnospiraceae bacterium]
MENVIKIHEIEQTFGEKTVLKNINMEIAKGEILGLLGPSGAGKTTLIKILTGQLKPSKGKAWVFGKEATTLTGKDYRKIGMMMDNFGLYERMSCYDNLLFFSKVYGISKKKIEGALERVGLSEAKKTLASNLSKGMKSRLLLARVLMAEPEILFLDEPTSGLDPATTEEIHKVIREEQAKGVTVFLTTHNMAEAYKLCNHIALLNDGDIVEYGEPEEICRRYNHQKRIKLHLFNGEDMELAHDNESFDVLAKYWKENAIETIHSTEPNLETVFMELTGRKLD